MHGFVSFARWIGRGGFIIVMLIVLAAGGRTTPAAQATPAGLPPTTIFLPLLGKNAVQAVQPTSDAYFLPFEFAGEGVQNINTTDLVIDVNGGVHLIYEIVEFDRRIAYAYCPTNCVDRSKFSTAILASMDGAERQTIYNADLAVDSLGHPRVMWQVFNTLVFVYCDLDCTNAANWNQLNVASIQGLDWLGRHFVMDRFGGYHYVYADDELYEGTYYASCRQNCAQLANWSHVKIFEGIYTHPSLAVTSSGNPRFTFLTLDDQFVSRLGYAECDANCLDPQGWSARTFEPFGPSEGSFTLRMDRQDRPRIALSPWWSAEGGFTPQQITYMWCNANCAQAATTWSRALMPMPGDDITISSIDMVLDDADRPVLAFNESGSGMHLARCTANCESTSAVWTIELFDSTVALNQNEPVPPRPGCSFPTWSTGYETSLALDAADKPRVAYDTNHLWLCGSSVTTDIMWARYKQW